jgi:hypothetical protein
MAGMLIGQAAFAEDVVKVTADNYVRAETDYQVKTYVEDLRCFGKFVHGRKPYDVNNQTTVRANRDTLYSFAVFDLTTPVTITKPDTGDRFQSFQIIDEDQYTSEVVYKPGKYTFTREDIGTRYVSVRS